MANTQVMGRRDGQALISAQAFRRMNGPRMRLIAHLCQSGQSAWNVAGGSSIEYRVSATRENRAEKIVGETVLAQGTVIALRLGEGPLTC